MSQLSAAAINASPAGTRTSGSEQIIEADPTFVPDTETGPAAPGQAGPTDSP
jgi:hypothetical protein